METTIKTCKTEKLKSENGYAQIAGTSTDEHSVRSQMRMGSESDCLFGQLDRILWTSDSETKVKTEVRGSGRRRG